MISFSSWHSYLKRTGRRSYTLLREQLDTMHGKDNHQKDGSESNDSLSAPVAGQSTRARGPEESVSRSFRNEQGPLSSRPMLPPR